jgi:ATP adenylyltransferase
MYHYRKTRQVYKKHNANDHSSRFDCPFPFCTEEAKQPILYENETMFIIANRVSYDVFEGRDVQDHLMVIPKRHVETLDKLTEQEKIDLMTIAGEYEVRGYNIYARGMGSVSRSVKHQHTHLIKLNNKKPRVYFFWNKPYFVTKV